MFIERIALLPSLYIIYTLISGEYSTVRGAVPVSGSRERFVHTVTVHFTSRTGIRNCFDLTRCVGAFGAGSFDFLEGSFNCSFLGMAKPHPHYEYGLPVTEYIFRYGCGSRIRTRL